ncbi:hypothetical protein [Caproicibacterium sp. XB1]|uniref:hypothetical protein n=1 Tax=Caproicibacterium sp. XB1 TaxID=3396405 RepID=UPI0039B6ED43
MSEAIISRRGDAGIPQSVAYPIVAILTTSGTWTAPRSGTYRVTCIGSGGCGAFVIGYYASIPSMSTANASGGGAGGIAESIIKLQKGNQITVTIDGAISSFGNSVSASAGSNAGQTFTTGTSVYDGGAYVPSVGLGGGGFGDNVYAGGDGISLIRANGVIGGSTNTNSPFGGAAGNKFLYIVSKCAYAWMLMSSSLSQNGFYPFGAGQGDKYDSSAGSNNINKNQGTVINGAVIIEQIK